VITTAQTFVATAMAILYAGARPVFADIQSHSPNLDPTDIERRITPRTKAILVVHYGGYPCDLDEINLLAARFHLTVIEDAAQSLGAIYKGKAVGGCADFGAFSFQAIKQLTTGDGGMLLCRDEHDHQLAYRRRWFGIDRAGRTPSETGQPEWDITEVGYKYHMNDIAGAMGLAQLEFFEAALMRRRQLNRVYRNAFGGVTGLELLDEKPDRQGACWLFTVEVERRADFIRALRGRGIEAAVWHQRIDLNSVFGGLCEGLVNQTRFSDRQVSLPLRESLTDDEVSQIQRSVQMGW
jgi:perosamine synthetase